MLPVSVFRIAVAFDGSRIVILPSNLANVFGSSAALAALEGDMATELILGFLEGRTISDTIIV
jgi:hypothetical protein